MKRFTLTMMGLLMLLGGASLQAQTVTTLYLNGGANWDATDGTNEWHDYTSGITYTSGNVKLKGKGWNPGSCCLTGSNWIASVGTDESHSFTVTLSEAPGNNHFVLAGGDPTYGEFDRADENGHYKVLQRIAADATSATIVLTQNYTKVCIINTEASNEVIKIASITRTVTTASSVAAPTISPASGAYDGELSVTITPGANNDHVKYSISGSSQDVDNGTLSTATTFNLTGTQDITITATGYDDANETNASSVVTKTYTYDTTIPSGIITVWTGNTTFADGDAGWNTTEVIDKSNFANLEVGDYIFLYTTHSGAVPNIGFRNNWDDSVFKTYLDTSGGSAAYGNMTVDESYWWVKITDTTIRDLFKTGTPRIQGQSFTLTKVEIHKAMTLSANADNNISKCTDMIVTIDRPFVAGTWNTVCLPFVPTADQANKLFGTGYKIAAFTSVSGTTMHFTKLNSIDNFEAGVPYLVKPAEGCATAAVTFTDVDITAKTGRTVKFDDYYSFVGTLTTKTFAESECNTSRFVASGNELTKPTPNSTLKSLRCYFTVPAESQARSFTVDEEGGATGVEELKNSNTKELKSYFNLAGQRVTQPSKGLYIVNGRKVVIK